MKSRSQIYRGEGECLLKLITTYHALQYEQVLQFFIRNRDSMKSLITSLTQLPPSEDGGLLWSKDHFLRLKVACRLKPVSFATKVA